MAEYAQIADLDDQGSQLLTMTIGGEQKFCLIVGGDCVANWVPMPLSAVQHLAAMHGMRLVPDKGAAGQ
jgi:hypothetical protein